MLFSPITWNSIVFEGVEYTCPMTAFQAQKAPKDKRTSYAKLGPGEAAAQGRAETIDCTMWDANRIELMTQILKSLAKQHESVYAGMLIFDFDDDSVNLLPDPFWKLQLPKIWKQIRDNWPRDKKRT